MSNLNQKTESDFVTAYCYCYGTSRAKAKEVYRHADYSYICAVIESFHRDMTASFGED